MTRLSVEQYLAKITRDVSLRSTCSRLNVGAVVVLETRIISTGYNGVVSGIKHCYHEEGDDTPCSNSAHAEENAIAFAARCGISTLGASLWSTHLPCLPCSRLIINAGIAEVVYLETFRSLTGLHLLREAGIKARKLEEPQ